MVFTSTFTTNPSSTTREASSIAAFVAFHRLVEIARVAFNEQRIVNRRGNGDTPLRSKGNRRGGGSPRL